MQNKKKAFTLFEILLVAVIIGILATIAIPSFNAYITRARESEAIAALSALRIAERMRRAEFGSYVNVSEASHAALDDYIGWNELDGTYFSSECYSVTGATANTFTARCDTSASTAPQRAPILALTYDITMNQDGVIARPAE